MPVKTLSDILTALETIAKSDQSKRSIDDALASLKLLTQVTQDVFAILNHSNTRLADDLDLFARLAEHHAKSGDMQKVAEIRHHMRRSLDTLDITAHPDMAKALRHKYFRENQYGAVYVVSSAGFTSADTAGLAISIPETDESGEVVAVTFKKVQAISDVSESSRVYLVLWVDELSGIMGITSSYTASGVIYDNENLTIGVDYTPSLFELGRLSDELTSAHSDDKNG